MRLEELDFHIPKSSIAQEAAEPRDSCRLMYLDSEGSTADGWFTDLVSYLRPGDTLVVNDSRVLPARLAAGKESGGKVELLFLRPAAVHYPEAGEVWEVLARPSQRLRPGAVLRLAETEPLTLRERLGGGRWLVECLPGGCMETLMEAYGKLPLPPYIRTYPQDPSSYQTVYAATPGSAAAPTAGLHFTPELLERLQSCGVRVAYVTLHVGLDTFLPIREPVIEEHRIHRETFTVSQHAMEAIRDTRRFGGRLVAVGTTAARVLETLAGEGALNGSESVASSAGSTGIYITPGYQFRAVDLLLTNFHLPRSTVLALVMAFAGVERIRLAYSHALEVGYRFFSFGDAMLIEAPKRAASDARQSA